MASRVFTRLDGFRDRLSADSGNSAIVIGSKCRSKTDEARRPPSPARTEA
jgi:hypothetical protein